jgi:hypothetical protein
VSNSGARKPGCRLDSSSPGAALSAAQREATDVVHEIASCPHDLHALLDRFPRSASQAGRRKNRDDSARDKRERTHQENALDEALKDTLLASAPVVSVEQPTPPAADRDRAKT